MVDIPPLAWVGFFGLVATILAIDLGYFHRRAHAVSVREASFWAGLWISVGLAFAVVVFWIYSQGATTERGVEAAQLYVTAYILEESLSVDNLFVFIIIFRHFGVSGEHQHQVLFFGILGAILMRGLFIFLGVAALHAFGGTIYILAGLLLLTAARMTVGGQPETDPSKSTVYRVVKRLMPMSEKPHDGEFFHRTDGRLHATTLFLCLVLIELTDVLFAIDSVPAVLGITAEAFIVYTSNILAIVGLRSLYFVVAAGLRGLVYLKPALVVLLAFIGIKMILSGPYWHLYDMPVSVSLSIVGGILGLAVAFSLHHNRKHPQAPRTQETAAPGAEKQS